MEVIRYEGKVTANKYSLMNAKSFVCFVRLDLHHKRFVKSTTAQLLGDMPRYTHEEWTYLQKQQDELIRVKGEIAAIEDKQTS